MTTSGDTPDDRYGTPPSQPPPPQHGYLAGTTSDERNWAMAAHLGSLLAAWAALGLLAPLVVLVTRGNDSAYIRRHAVESLNFQINALVYTVVFGLLIFVLIGLLLLPLYGIFYLTCVIIASVRVSRGEDFRYPLTVRVIT